MLIPEIWSGKIIEKIYDRLDNKNWIFDYEGEIHRLGDSVMMLDRKRSRRVLLLVDQEVRTEFRNPDVVRIQCDIDRMEKATEKIAKRIIRKLKVPGGKVFFASQITTEMVRNKIDFSDILRFTFIYGCKPYSKISLDNSPKRC